MIAGTLLCRQISYFCTHSKTLNIDKSQRNSEDVLHFSQVCNPQPGSCKDRYDSCVARKLVIPTQQVLKGLD